MDWATPRQTVVEVTSTDTSFGTSFFPFSLQAPVAMAMSKIRPPTPPPRAPPRTAAAF